LTQVFSPGFDFSLVKAVLIFKIGWIVARSSPAFFDQKLIEELPVQPCIGQQTPVLIALQNIATIVAILTVSRLSVDPVQMIRASALVMAAAVAVSFFSPFGFAAIGAAAGAVQISQLRFLALSGEPQGVVVGVFNTAAYAGMAVLPVVATVVARSAGYAPAFGIIVLVSVSVALTIARCKQCEWRPAA
jgi:hypothetical protein